jgi:hypothetical protein
MSHKRDPGVPGSDRAPTTSTPGVLRTVRRHLAEWPRRYVEMRVGAVEDRTE